MAEKNEVVEMLLHDLLVEANSLCQKKFLYVIRSVFWAAILGTFCRDYALSNEIEFEQPTDESIGVKWMQLVNDRQLTASGEQLRVLDGIAEVIPLFDLRFNGRDAREHLVRKILAVAEIMEGVILAESFLVATRKVVEVWVRTDGAKD